MTLGTGTQQLFPRSGYVLGKDLRPPGSPTSRGWSWAAGGQPLRLQAPQACGTPRVNQGYSWLGWGLGLRDLIALSLIAPPPAPCQADWGT